MCELVGRYEQQLTGGGVESKFRSVGLEETVVYDGVVPFVERDGSEAHDKGTRRTDLGDTSSGSRLKKVGWIVIYIH